MIKKLLLLILVLFTFSTFTVFAAEEEPIEEIPTEEVEETTEVGLVESLFVGFFDFVTSDEFTKLATSLGALMLALYPFIKKYLSAKAQAKYESLNYNLINWKNKADEYEKLTLKYATIADNALKQVEAIKDSLILGFDKSNLRQDVKDKIMYTLNNVPKLDIPKVEDKPIVENESINVDEEKDNRLTETIEDTELETNKGW